jgi:predicted ATPase/DNA-binding SARP family transcriptional activator
MLHLLGTPQWRTDERSHPLPNTLPGWTLAFLALQGDWVSRERLIVMLWPDATAADAQHNLRVDLHRARAVLASWGIEEALEAERRRVRLTLPTDVQSLRRAAAQDGGPVPEFPGDLLASMGFEGFPALREWVEIERTALAAQWRDAMLARIERNATTSGERVAMAQALLEADPFDEAALIRLVESLRELGRSHEADKQVRQYGERLARDLGLEPSQAVRAAAASLAAAPSAAAVAAPADARAFVGRRIERAELVRRLGGAARLVTLVGPGGVGKSSLAREVLAHHDRPATWIDLQDLSAIEGVASRVAQRLGVDLNEQQDAVAQLARALGDKPILLVLDNAEHLAAALRDFVGGLLAAVPALTLLVTSRRPLGVDGEQRLSLEGLACPDEDSRDAEAATAFDAVQLFALRARSTVAGFDVARHIGAVVEVVDAVGGLPLAIELAASWVRLMAPEQIARELRQSVDLLERDPASGPQPTRPEHASLRAVLDRSWALLPEREQAVLLALGVFSGGFTAAAARRVADAPLPLLAALADKSLLATDGAGRFAMHPLVAADMAERAAQDTHSHAVRADRHAEYFAGMLEATLDRHVDDGRTLAREMEEEMPNLERAWQRAATSGRGDLARRMLPAWYNYFEVRGRYAMACSHLRRMIDALSPSEAGRLPLASLRANLAHFLIRSGGAEAARPLALDALAAAEPHGDAVLARFCISALGGCAMALGRWEEARTWFERVRDLDVEAGDARGVAAAWNSLALVASYQGDAARALHCAEQALSGYRQLANHQGVARGLMNIVQIHASELAWAEARRAAESALQHATQHGLSAIALMSEFWLGVACVERGDLDAGRKHLQRAQERCAAEGMAVFAFKAGYYLALAACRSGERDQGLRDLLMAARMAFERGWVEDQLYLAIFIGEWLRDAGQRSAAARVLRAVMAAPDEVSDAAIRRLARHTLGTVNDPSDADAPPFEDIARRLATSDSADELAQRLQPAR